MLSSRPNMLEWYESDDCVSEYQHVEHILSRDLENLSFTRFG